MIFFKCAYSNTCKQISVLTFKTKVKRLKVKVNLCGQRRQFQVKTPRLFELDYKACKACFSPLARDGIPDGVSIICDRECVWRTTGPGRGQPRNTGLSLVTALQYSPLIGWHQPLLSRVRSEYLGRSSHSGSHTSHSSVTRGILVPGPFTILSQICICI